MDIASRYNDAEALTSKESKEVEKAFKKIYSRNLKWPDVLMVDSGKEFMGDVTTLMNKHKVKFQRSEAGNHRAQAFVERANRTLAERLFSHQYVQEMISEGRSTEWVKRLPAVLKAMNSEILEITGKEVKETKEIKQYEPRIEGAPLRNKVSDRGTNGPSYKRIFGLDEVRLPPSVKVRYLYSSTSILFVNEIYFSSLFGIQLIFPSVVSRFLRKNVRHNLINYEVSQGKTSELCILNYMIYVQCHDISL